MSEILTIANLLTLFEKFKLGSLESVCLVKLLHHGATHVLLFCLVSFRQTLNFFIVVILDLMQFFVCWALVTSATDD